jgi:hypothetical protein
VCVPQRANAGLPVPRVVVIVVVGKLDCVGVVDVTIVIAVGVEALAILSGGVGGRREQYEKGWTPPSGWDIITLDSNSDNIITGTTTTTTTNTSSHTTITPPSYL